MFGDNFIQALRAEIVELVAEEFSPIALHYGYSEVPLETNIKWRPLVLLIGNYSSGKSTLINEFLGANTQATGQAPTDDSFTVLTYDSSEPPGTPIRVTEERDGKVLLNDPKYPFENFKKYGERFAAHFRLKKVNSPFLKDLAVIDTPGMLDSITERDRGYDYQQVIGDFAQLADLVLVLFDPHKAGTVREAYKSIRDTLPATTFEDRVLFVLNRIDECNSLIDLLRVYGTLCWNLSQITGRKDIPMIHLTYSPHVIDATQLSEDQKSYLAYLENQREVLKQAVQMAPRYRLDHLASFLETNGDRLSHLLEALISYRKRFNWFRGKLIFVGLLLSVAAGAAALTSFLQPDLGLYTQPPLTYGIGGATALGIYLLWQLIVTRIFAKAYHRKALSHIDKLTVLDSQSRIDSWAGIRETVYNYIKFAAGRFKLRDLKPEYTLIRRATAKGSKEIREVLGELGTIKHRSPFAELPAKPESSHQPLLKGSLISQRSPGYPHRVDPLADPNKASNG
jgi:hypothetical protein